MERPKRAKKSPNRAKKSRIRWRAMTRGWQYDRRVRTFAIDDERGRVGGDVTEDAGKGQKGQKKSPNSEKKSPIRWWAMTRGWQDDRRVRTFTIDDERGQVGGDVIGDAGKGQKGQKSPIGWRAITRGLRGWREGLRGWREGLRGWREGLRGWREVERMTRGLRWWREVERMMRGLRWWREGLKGWWEGLKGWREGLKGWREGFRTLTRGWEDGERGWEDDERGLDDDEIDEQHREGVARHRGKWQVRGKEEIKGQPYIYTDSSGAWNFQNKWFRLRSRGSPASSWSRVSSASCWA